MADRDPQFGRSAIGTELLVAALDYAARGWPVFPCSPQTKAPLLGNDVDPETGKKIPKTGGFKRASCDPDLIRGWWTQWPRALIGIATGHDRLFVLDFDPRADEDTGECWTLARLKDELEEQMGCGLPMSLTSVTQSGGVHVWLRWPDDGGEPITNRGNLPLHVDVRGQGGYVIAPPSIMATGREYHWRRREGVADHPETTSIAEAPMALIDILRRPKAAFRKAPADRPVDRNRDSGPSHGRADDPVDAARRKWSLAAFDSAIREAEGLREGQRNTGINAIAFRLGRLIGAGYLGEAMVRAALEQVARLWPDAEKTVDTISRAVEDGKGQPRDMSDVGALAGSRAPHPASRRSHEAGPANDNASLHAEAGGQPWAGGSGGHIRVEPDPDNDRPCASLPQTDLGNAERFYRRHGRNYRFCPELGWFLWDGRRWRLLAEEKDKVPGEVMQAVFATVRAIGHEADLVAASGCREDASPEASAEELAARLDFIAKETRNGITLFSDTLRAHAKASEGKGRLEAIAGLVKNMPGVLVRADAFDVDREAINVRNGTIRIVADGHGPRIELSPHRRKDLITKMAEVEYDPAAACPIYDRFFERIMPDPDDRRFLHQWGGLSATGDISHHKMAFFWGKGRNGKSTWVDVLATIYGDYSMTIGFDTFLDQANKKKGSDATPDLARLPGVRFLRASEPEKGAKLAEGLIKEVTGGERIQARHLNKGFFEFLPSFKFTGQGNYRPKISGHDDGIWSRVRLVPFTVRIPDSEIDRQLPEKLRAERSGIFNRMMAGLIDLRINGLLESANIQRATEKYREASDALGRFLRDCTADKAGARVKSSELFATFTAWARASGAGEWTVQGFAKAMEDRGYERKTSNGVWWLDIEATADMADIEAGRFGDADSGPLAPAGGNEAASSARNDRSEDDDFVPWDE